MASSEAARRGGGLGAVGTVLVLLLVERRDELRWKATVD